MQALLFLVTIWVAASAATSLLMEDLTHVPENWHSVGVPEASRPLQLRIAMKQPNEALFEETLLNISDPTISRYGKHMQRKELKDMLRPSHEATEAVTLWLGDVGITGVEDDGEWISFVATTAQAEELLHTRFEIYRHDEQDIRRSRFRITTQFSGKSG